MSVFLFLVTENIFILWGLPAALNETLLQAATVTMAMH
jgi:hypothetical protein